MSRRSTPERLSQARRAATLARLVSAGELPERAATRLDAYEAMTTGDGRPRDGRSGDSVEVVRTGPAPPQAATEHEPQG